MIRAIKRFFLKFNNLPNKNNPENLNSKSFSFTEENRTLRIFFTNDFYTNITLVAKFFSRNFLHWTRRNTGIIKYFQKMYGSKPIIRTTKGRKGATWVAFELLVQVLQSYSKPCAWSLSKHYLAGQAEIEHLNIKLSNLKGKKSLLPLPLWKGGYLYGFTCNGLSKIGDSLKNKTGRLLRLRSHASSIPGFKCDFVMFLQSVHIVALRKILKQRFTRQKNNREHFVASTKVIKKFIIEYCDLMNWNYLVLSQDELDEFNKSI